MEVLIYKTSPRCCLLRTETCYSLHYRITIPFSFSLGLVFTGLSIYLRAKPGFLQCLSVGRCWGDPWESQLTVKDGIEGKKAPKIKL